MKGQGEKGIKWEKRGEGEEKEKKMEEISLNGGEGFQEASWGVGNVFKKIEEYTPLLQSGDQRTAGVVCGCEVLPHPCTDV